MPGHPEPLACHPERAERHPERAERHPERAERHPERSEGSAVTVLELPRYEVVGSCDAPTIVALGGISANRHICASAAHPSPGWWESVAGPGRPLSTSHYSLVGMDFLDAGTTHDQADAVAAVLDELEIPRVHALVGASYGGMVALAFAERYPERLERLVVIGAAHRPHPMTTALRIIQRRIVELGWETDRAHDALVLARALATTTYRSAREFADRFGCHPERSNRHSERSNRHSERSEESAVEAVESYLLHQGEKFAARFTPARFLALSLSADLHSVDPAQITVPTTLVAAEGDTNVPREQLEELARLLGGPSRLVDLPSDKGHDAFLTEPIALGRILTEAFA